MFSTICCCCSCSLVVILHLDYFFFSCCCSPLLLLLVVVVVHYSLSCSLLVHFSLLISCSHHLVVVVVQVGYGDRKPETLEGRLFAIFFVLMGFSILAYGFSLAASYALEKAETMKAKHETRVHLLMNKVADIRLSLSFNNLKKKLLTTTTTTTTSLKSSKSSSQNVVDVGDIELQQHVVEKERSISSDIDDEDEAMIKNLDTPSESYSSVSQLSRSYEQSFQYETYKLQRRCIRNLILIFSFMLIASLIMMSLEGWTFSDSLYWAVVTITTVGYGGKTFIVVVVVDDDKTLMLYDHSC